MTGNTKDEKINKFFPSYYMTKSISILLLMMLIKIKFELISHRQEMVMDILC